MQQLRHTCPGRGAWSYTSFRHLLRSVTAHGSVNVEPVDFSLLHVVFKCSPPGLLGSTSFSATSIWYQCHGVLSPLLVRAMHPHYRLCNDVLQPSLADPFRFSTSETGTWFFQVTPTILRKLRWWWILNHYDDLQSWPLSTDLTVKYFMLLSMFMLYFLSMFIFLTCGRGSLIERLGMRFGEEYGVSENLSLQLKFADEIYYVCKVLLRYLCYLSWFLSDILHYDSSDSSGHSGIVIFQWSMYSSYRSANSSRKHDRPFSSGTW